MRPSKIVFFRAPDGRIWSRIDFHVAEPIRRGKRKALQHRLAHGILAVVWASLEPVTSVSQREHKRHMAFWRRHKGTRKTTYRLFPGLKERC